MTTPDYSTFGHAEETTTSKGRPIIRFNGIAPTVAEWCWVAERMAVIQHETFTKDENAALSILGDLFEISDTNTPEATWRWANAIKKKWDGVRLIAAHRRTA